MERDLSDRDRVGLTDQVLLENYTSEEAFIDNLEKRFNNDLIYVSWTLSFHLNSSKLIQMINLSDLHWPSLNLC